ncbi:hypothetical protein DMUE_6093 [Dictyocoela muelleri]|nr:hypothetical protein DMUE_6093 [Dictyocoela muelleri]
MTFIFSSSSKYFEIDNFLIKNIKNIKILRSKNIAIYNSTCSIWLKIFTENRTLYSRTTPYYIKTFVKRQNLYFITIHWESSSADKSNIEQFKEELLDLVSNFPPGEI